MSTLRKISAVAAVAAVTVGALVVLGIVASALSILVMALFSGPWWSGPLTLAVGGGVWAIVAGAVWLIQWGADVLEARHQRDYRRADGWARWDR